MPRFHHHFRLGKTLVAPRFGLLVAAAVLGAFTPENASAGSSVPLVYGVENTGAGFAAPVFPSFEQLPIIRPLPDPFVFADGTRDTSFDNWARRRSEIKASIEKYEIGPKPDCSDCTITATYTPAAPPATRGSLVVVITRNAKSMTLTANVTIPQTGTGPFPALIPMGTGTWGSLPSSIFTARPIASVTYNLSSVTRYGNPSPNDPFYQLYPELCAGTACAGGSNSGQYAAWSWGVSRLIDGIAIATKQAVNPLPVDLEHLAVTGCSYAGKMALFAGAFDERIALTIAQENGGGGAPAWRVTDEIEAFNVSEDIQRTDKKWFASQMWQFAGVNRYKLPTDHHELMAMIAPRALLETGNTGYFWLSNRSNYISARATQQIYNTLGIGDRFGFIIDGGHFHCAVPATQIPLISGFVDKFMLGDATANTDVQVTPYPTLDTARWTAWWGTNDPKFPNNWNPGDGSIVMSMNRPLSISAGDNLVAGYDLWMDGNHPAATVSLGAQTVDATGKVTNTMGGTVTTDVSCPDGSSYTLAIPVPYQSYSIAAGDNAWYPSPNQKSPLVYQGSATASGVAPATACSGGVATSAYFSATGLSVGTGNPATPGFASTDTTDPLNVRFHCDISGSKGAGGSWSPTTVVNYPPQ